MFLRVILVVAVVTALASGFGSPAGEGLSRRANKSPPSLSISGAALTSKWIEGSNKTQIIEMFLMNKDPVNYLTLADNLTVTASGSGITLVSPGNLTRLAPGDEAIVQVGITSKSVAPGANCTVTLKAVWGGSYGAAQSTTSVITGRCGFGDFLATKADLGYHQSPDWYNNIKFGIFIHWGIYSVPGYGGVTPNEVYAEWYWHNMNSVNSATYNYHKKTYGTNVNYDDFIANFTAVSFNAKDWVDLIASAGAKYIVPVTKHHDGFAMFNFSSSISTRSSVYLGPKVDFIGALLNAAKTYHPEMRRGTYFSMPEWYNPLYKYSQEAASFPGGPPKNPYTGTTLTYTGYVPGKDFIQDIQVPQQNELAYTYETEIMWCDIGGPSDAFNFASKWYNWARDQNRQVTMNNRCGSSLSGDWTTPEYTTNSKTVARKWESNRGMDPFSFGYNAATPLNKYMTGGDIVQSLVDIVSKNGNFLLDIGPKGDGTIPDIMQTGLTDAGSWIIPHGESIFNTRYWSRTPGLDPFRYTTTNDAFYVHIISKPSTTVKIPDPVPYLVGDTVTVVGGSMNGTKVSMTANSDGTRTLTLTPAIIAADKYVWTFKIAYTSTL